MQVKTGFNTPIFNNILFFLYKSGTISIIYYKYGKSFWEIILLPASYAMRIPWKNFLVKFRFFYLLIILNFGLCNKKLCIYFWKRLVVYQKLGLLFKKIKDSNSAEFIVFLWNFAHVSTKKCWENRIFFWIGRSWENIITTR